MKRYKRLTIVCDNDADAIKELVNIEKACVIPEFKYDEEIE